MAKKLGPLPKKVNSNETPAHEVRYVAVFEPNTFTIKLPLFVSTSPQFESLTAKSTVATSLFLYTA